MGDYWWGWYVDAALLGWLQDWVLTPVLQAEDRKPGAREGSYMADAVPHFAAPLPVFSTSRWHRSKGGAHFHRAANQPQLTRIYQICRRLFLQDGGPG